MSDSKHLSFDEWYDKYFDENSTFPSADEAWNHQQEKIDAVLHFIDNMDTIDIENDVVLRNTVYEIQELLK